MRSPAGLGPVGKSLWKSMHDEFDFAEEPHKLQILAQTCRVADIVAELDEAADEAPLTVKGSMGQLVISPFIAEARVQRAVLAQLIGRLGLPDTDEVQAEQVAKLSRTRRYAGARGGPVVTVRWNRKQEPEQPAFTVADYYRMKLTTPDNTTPASYEDYLDYLRRAEISDRQSQDDYPAGPE
jgi:hypothetical protein